MSALLLIAPLTVAADDLTAAHQVATADPALAAASMKAHDGLDDFLAKEANPPAGTSNYAVKVALADDQNGGVTVGGEPRNAEYFWLIDVEPEGDGFSATLANEPEVVRNVRNGQKISFKKDDIYDWTYMDNGKLVGNYSACAILLSGPKAELKQFEDRFNTKCSS
ncbi:DUF2314 domain-containing protein [Rhizobium halophytocola]|uniref:Uncharacterized protein YegJ (DUF2314 family) n=1 Tax=Rhizobium halophytocola TaxID=735519 RepID=A0ABS4DTF1_9HYPH|nr:DUF2314 domain-containing protein [Rhizobium halophytocola]MBP1848960.1 uncharacterized protein YegJ (DUF2314 family) [Rhizobium halophytocola]